MQTTAAGISVAQVARRYALSSNLIFKWLRDPRYMPDLSSVEDQSVEPLCFLPVEIIAQPQSHDADNCSPSTPDLRRAQSAIEIDIAGGHHLRIVGSYDPEALARLIRGLTP